MHAVTTLLLLTLAAGAAAQGSLPSKAVQDAIVAEHNKYRARERSSNMLQMYWNEDVAKSAMAYFRGSSPGARCNTGHDGSDPRARAAGFNIPIGQNLAYGSIYSGNNEKSWRDVITAWWDEIKDFSYGRGSTNGKAVGHYTQVVQGNAVAVGCAYRHCSSNSYEHFYACNYAYGQMGYETPYERGSCSSSTCGGTCRGNLCDCGAKVCKKRRWEKSGSAWMAPIMTLDITTCACIDGTDQVGSGGSSGGSPPSSGGNTRPARPSGGNTRPSGGSRPRPRPRPAVRPAPRPGGSSPFGSNSWSGGYSYSWG